MAQLSPSLSSLLIEKYMYSNMATKMGQLPICNSKICYRHTKYVFYDILKVREHFSIMLLKYLFFINIVSKQTWWQKQILYKPHHTHMLYKFQNYLLFPAIQESGGTNVFYGLKIPFLILIVLNFPFCYCILLSWVFCLKNCCKKYRKYSLEMEK